MKIGLGWTLGIMLFSMVVSYRVAAETDVLVDSVIEEAKKKSEKGDLDGAAAMYHKALKMDSKNEEARRGLADAVVEGHIKDPEAEQPDVLHTIMKEEDIQAALPSIQFSLSFLSNGSLGPNDKSMSLAVLQILTQLQGGDYGAAIPAAESLKKKNSKHPVPYNLLGLAWQGKGDPSLARDFFKESLLLKENFHAARINLAELELYLGEFSTAHQELEMVLKKDVKNRRACLAMANLLTLEGKLDEANQWYHKTSGQL